jgi:predicted deacylase
VTESIDSSELHAGPIPYDQFASGTRHRLNLAAGHMADGTTVSLPVLVAVGQEARPRLVCVAGIHGNEPEGITALLDIWDGIAPEELRGTIVLVPVANPPAFRAGDRRNPQDPLDMNRIFPGSETGTITERLAHRLFHDAVAGADFVVTLHGWTRGGMVVPYVEYPRDCAVTAASRAAAACFGLQWLEAFDWPAGMLAAVCASHGIPAIEPEIGGLEATTREGRSRYVRGIHNVMRHLGMVPGRPDDSPQPRDVERAQVVAPEGGLIRWRRELGEPVAGQEAIATICDLLGRSVAEVTSPMEGFIAAQRQAAAVNPGEQLAVIFRAKAETASCS